MANQRDSLTDERMMELACYAAATPGEGKRMARELCKLRKIFDAGLRKENERLRIKGEFFETVLREILVETSFSSLGHARRCITVALEQAEEEENDG